MNCCTSHVSLLRPLRPLSTIASSNKPRSIIPISNIQSIQHCLSAFFTQSLNVNFCCTSCRLLAAIQIWWRSKITTRLGTASPRHRTCFSFIAIATSSMEPFRFIATSNTLAQAQRWSDRSTKPDPQQHQNVHHSAKAQRIQHLPKQPPQRPLPRRGLAL